MSDRLELRGLRLVAPVGVLESEREQPQPISIDIDVAVDLSAAGRSDRLDDTVSYAEIASEAARIACGSHHDLLESLAEQIGQAALDLDPRVTSCTVTVTKLRPPIALDLDTVGIRRLVER